MDWNAFFKTVKEKAVLPEVKPGETPKWYDVRYWKIGEWGSAASIIGVGLWSLDHSKLLKKGKKK